MNCNEHKQNLALLAGRDLEDDEAVLAKRHTVECPSCREMLRQLEDSQTAMRVVRETPAEINGRSLWPRIRAQLMPATIERQQNKFPNWMPTATLAAACLALLVFASSPPLLNVQQGPVSFLDSSFGESADPYSGVQGTSFGTNVDLQLPSNLPPGYYFRDPKVSQQQDKSDLWQ